MMGNPSDAPVKKGEAIPDSGMAPPLCVQWSVLFFIDSGSLNVKFRGWTVPAAPNPQGVRYLLRSASMSLISFSWARMVRALSYTGVSTILPL